MNLIGVDGKFLKYQAKQQKANQAILKLQWIHFTNSADYGLQLHLENGDQQICKEVRIQVTIDGKRPFREMVVYFGME